MRFQRSASAASRAMSSSVYSPRILTSILLTMPRTPSARSAPRSAFHFSAKDGTSPVSVTMPSSTATPILRASTLGSQSSSSMTSLRSSWSDFTVNLPLTWIAMSSRCCHTAPSRPARRGTSRGRVVRAQGLATLPRALRLPLGHRRDLRRHLDLLADQDAAGLESLVPVQTELRAVDLRLGAQDDPLVAPGIGGESLVLAGHQDLPGDAMQGEVTADVEAATVLAAHAGRVELDLAPPGRNSVQHLCPYWA